MPAIEKRDQPEFRDVPVIFGGRHRGVVLACCYIPRTDGVRWAMPMFRALKLALTPLVEPVSLDEAFMARSDTESRQVEDDLSITVSIGLSYNTYGYHTGHPGPRTTRCRGRAPRADGAHLLLCQPHRSRLPSRRTTCQRDPGFRVAPDHDDGLDAKLILTATHAFSIGRVFAPFVPVHGTHIEAFRDEKKSRNWQIRSLSPCGGDCPCR